MAPKLSGTKYVVNRGGGVVVGVSEQVRIDGESDRRRGVAEALAQPQPVLWPNGKPYENTINDWQALDTASLAARYLEMIPPDVLVDRRNTGPSVYESESFFI